LIKEAFNFPLGITFYLMIIGRSEPAAPFNFPLGITQRQGASVAVTTVGHLKLPFNFPLGITRRRWLRDDADVEG
jgi:hypothetical protein